MKLPDLFIINVLREFFQLPVWWISAFHRRDPKTWVFGAWFGNTYSDNAKSMFEYVLANHPGIKAIWITNNSNVFDKLKSDSIPVVLKGTKESRKACMDAGYVFITNSAIEMETLYINGAKQVWLWHGMPLKHIGNAFQKAIPIKRRIHESFPQNKCYSPDYFISTSHKWDPILKQAFNIHNDLIVSGLPRNDRFFDDGSIPFVSDIDSMFNRPTKILYMPTFRDNLYHKNESFNPFNQFGFSFERFINLLEEVNAVFLYKGHYCDILNQHQEKSQNDRFILVNESMYDDLYSFIKDVDVLMTDYSSIYFDFLLLKKPIILAPFDKDSYCSNSRAMYFDYNKEIDGVRAYNWNDVIDIIKEKKYYVPSQEIIDRFHEFQDGNSAKRITEYILSQL